MNNILEMKNITKKFPGVVANDKVSLDIKPGEIHALVGENGSGKSTLMNILYGLYSSDEGETWLKGKKVNINDPRKAIDAGIGMVFQHFMLVETLTVAENVILGDERSPNMVVDFKKAVQEVNKLAAEYGLNVEAHQKIEDLSVGFQQRVEIIKALYRNAQILVLDEPTAVLTPQEVDDLFRVMRNLKEQGTTIIFITHKIKEVLAISDRVTVLRRGKKVGTKLTKETNRRELAEMMVGREVLLKVEKKPAQSQGEIFSIKDLWVKDNWGNDKVKGVSLTLEKGEILGIAGVEGNGQQHMVEAITGLAPTAQGSIQLNGVNLANLKPMQVKRQGVGYIPEDRHRRGLILDYSVADNLILGLHTKPPFIRNWIMIDNKAVRANAKKLVKSYDVRPPLSDVIVSKLSGGNQQKVVVAREVARDINFLICSQPTRGLDIGAIEFIHQEIVRQRDLGTSVLLISSELDEILSLSDRIAVMFNGKIVATISAAEANEQKLGYLMLGGSLEEYNESEEGGVTVET